MTALLRRVGGGVSGETFDYDWDVASQVDVVTTTSGLTRDYQFDDLGRLDTDVLTDSGANVLASFDYDYNTEFMLSKDVTLPGNAQSGLHSYDYDFAGRLDAWTNPVDGLVDYVWDGAGNRLSVGAESYTYDVRNRLEAGPEGSYAYTPRGTMESLTTATETILYDFDSLGRLVDYNSGEVSYSYDSLDRVADRNGSGSRMRVPVWTRFLMGRLRMGVRRRVAWCPKPMWEAPMRCWRGWMRTVICRFCIRQPGWCLTRPCSIRMVTR